MRLPKRFFSEGNGFHDWSRGLNAVGCETLGPLAEERNLQPRQEAVDRAQISLDDVFSPGSLDKLRHPVFLDAFPSTLTQAR